MDTTTYTDYFRQLAISHHQIRHNPKSENFDAPDGEQHFARFSTDEVLTGLISKISFPALLLELYEIDTTGENKLQIRPTYKGAFSIFQSAPAMNYTAQEQAYDLAEQILNDCLAKMYADHVGPGSDRCSSPFQDINFTSLNIIPVGPVFTGPEFGWRCEFQFTTKQMKSITTPPATGVFI